MEMVERGGRAAPRVGAVHEVAAIVEVLLDEVRRTDESFLAYLLELALDEASAVAARVPRGGELPRPPARRTSTAPEAAGRLPSRRDADAVQRATA